MRALDTLRKPVATVDAGTTLTDAARLMDEKVVGALVVTDGGRLVGIVTDRDMVVRGLARRLDPDARVDAVMTTEPVTLPKDADLRATLAQFRTHAIRRVVLVDDDRPVGLVSVDDLLVDLAADLGDLARPVTGEVLFGHPEPSVPATT